MRFRLNKGILVFVVGKPMESLSKHYKGKRVLVTGGASFIGSHLVELLVDHGARVTVVDDLSSGRREHLKAVRKHIAFHKADLRQPTTARRLVRGQHTIFHLAAMHGGRGYIESHPVECMNNLLLDHVVLAAAASAKARKIVFASSACAYPTTLQASDTQRLLLKESDANFDEPGKAFADGEYGWAKLMGELQLRAFHKQYGISGTSCRIFTAYGERENETHAVIALIAKAVLRLDPFPIWGSGRQTRNFTYVHDTVTGLALAGARLEGFEVVNLGSSQHHTILELCEEIFAAVGWRPAQIAPQLDRPVGVQSRAADNAHCRKLFGWEPNVSLREGVRRTVEAYVAEVTPARLKKLERLLVERD